MNSREQCEHGYRASECATCWKMVPGALGDTCDWGACEATATRRVRTNRDAPAHQQSTRQFCDQDAALAIDILAGVDVGPYEPPPPPPPPRLAGLSPTQARDLAIEHGWEFLRIEADGTMFTVRRLYLMATPVHILATPEEFGRRPFMRWPEPTFHQVEFLTFNFEKRRLRGPVFYDHVRAPWLDNARIKVSQRRAAEILAAAPPADAITDTTPAGGGA